MAIAAPIPATMPAATVCRSNFSPSGVLSGSVAIDASPQKQGGGRLLCRPQTVQPELGYFRLLIAVRSAENLTMPAAPHQLEPKAATPLPGLMAVTLFGLKLVVL